MSKQPEREIIDRRPVPRYFIIKYRAHDVERSLRMEALSKYDAKQKFKFKYPRLEYLGCVEEEE
jgi:hypothetical protein